MTKSFHRIGVILFMPIVAVLVGNILTATADPVLNDSTLILTGQPESKARQAEYKLETTTPITIKYPRGFAIHEVKATTITTFNVSCGKSPMLDFTRSSLRGSFNSKGMLTDSMNFSTIIFEKKETSHAKLSYYIPDSQHFQWDDHVADASNSPKIRDFCTQDGFVIPPTREQLIDWHKKLGKALDSYETK
jgi:hypothetical protein